MRIFFLTATIVLGFVSSAAAQTPLAEYASIPWAIESAPCLDLPVADYSWTGNTKIGSFYFSHLSLVPAQGTALDLNGVRYKLWFISVGKQDDELWMFKLNARASRVASAELTDAPLIGEPLGVLLDTVSLEYHHADCTLRTCKQLYVSAETKMVKWGAWDFSVESDWQQLKSQKSFFLHAKLHLDRPRWRHR